MLHELHPCSLAHARTRGAGRGVYNTGERHRSHRARRSRALGVPGRTARPGRERARPGRLRDRRDRRFADRAPAPPGGSAFDVAPFASMIGALVGGLHRAGGRRRRGQAFAITCSTARWRRPTPPAASPRARCSGLAVAWLVAVVALEQPSLQPAPRRPALDRAARRSCAPCRRPRADALARFDPLPVLPSIADRALPPPDPSVPHSAGAPAATSASVVRIEGTACGLGSRDRAGWCAPASSRRTPTSIAGEHDAAVEPPTARHPLGHPDRGRRRERRRAPARARPAAAAARDGAQRPLRRRRRADRLSRERPAHGGPRPGRRPGDRARPGRLRPPHPRPHRRAAARRARARRQRRARRRPRAAGSSR